MLFKGYCRGSFVPSIRETESAKGCTPPSNVIYRSGKRARYLDDRRQRLFHREPENPRGGLFSPADFFFLFFFKLYVEVIAKQGYQWERILRKI